MNKRGEWMRMMVFFDLPTTTKLHKHDACKFRNNLLKDGYDMMQWSVYSRLCHSLEVARRHQKYLKSIVPQEGSVRLMISQKNNLQKWISSWEI